eukprot:tig00020812_g14086.t1
MDIERGLPAALAPGPDPAGGPVSGREPERPRGAEAHMRSPEAGAGGGEAARAQIGGGEAGRASPGPWGPEHAESSEARHPSVTPALTGLPRPPSSKSVHNSWRTSRVHPFPASPTSPAASEGGFGGGGKGGKRGAGRRLPRLPLAGLLAALFAIQLAAACGAVIALNYFLNRGGIVSTAIQTSQLMVKSIRERVQASIVDSVLTALQAAAFEFESGKLSLERPVELVGSLAAVMARVPVVSYTYIGFASSHFYGASRTAVPATDLYSWKFDIANLSQPLANIAWGPTPDGGIDFSAPLSVQEYDPSTRPWFLEAQTAALGCTAADAAARGGRCSWGSRVTWGTPYKDFDDPRRLVLTPSLEIVPVLRPADPGGPVLATANFVPRIPDWERPPARNEPSLGKAVLGADIYLDTLQAVLREFKQTENTLVFITTRDAAALVVASSDPAAANLLQPASEAASAVLRAVQEHVGRPALEHGSFSIGSEGYEVSRVPLVFDGADGGEAGGGGLVVYIVLPQSDLTRELQRTTTISFAVAAAIVVAFGVSVLFTAVQMTRPLRLLVGAMNAIAHPSDGAATPPAALAHSLRRYEALAGGGGAAASSRGRAAASAASSTRTSASAVPRPTPPAQSRPSSFGPGRPLAFKPEPERPAERAALPPRTAVGRRRRARRCLAAGREHQLCGGPREGAAAATPLSAPAGNAAASTAAAAAALGDRRGAAASAAPTFLVPRGPAETSGVQNDSLVKEIAIAQVAFRSMCERLESIGKYLAQGVIEPLHRAGRLGKIGLEERELTIFFADVAGFTSLSESIPPERLAPYLQCYLTAASHAIQEQGGTVDKFIGDGVMAFWNAPSAVAGHGAAACRAAVTFSETLEALAPSLALRDLPPFKVRMGIHKGVALVGNVGSDDRMNYTCIGDAVNLASRLESLGKFYGVQSIISESVHAEAKGAHLCRMLDRAVVVGRSQPQEELARRYEAALRTLWARDIAAALAAFGDLARDFPRDGPTRVMLERAGRFSQDPAAFSDVFVASYK